MQKEATLEHMPVGIKTLAARKPLLVGTIICVLAAMFYMYEFILQVSTSVMTNELMRDLGLNAASVGMVSAAYFFAYTPMQLPAGLLYDRYGPRALITIAILICACGALFFGLTTNAFMASSGRFFMGIGSAFSFIGALLLVSRWFPPQYFALIAGLVQLMSSVGAITGQGPLAIAIAHWGWRHSIMALSIIGVLLAILVWLIVRNSPSEIQKQSQQSVADKMNEWQRLRQVCGNKQTWLVGFYSFLIWAPITVFTELWGVPFLSSAYNLSKPVASAACAMTWLAIGIGSPLIGWWSDRIGKRCLPLSICAISGILAILVIAYVPHLSMGMLYVLLFMFGFAASGQSLAFGLVKDNNHPNVTGTAIGFNNMSVVAGGVLLQPLASWLVQLHWNGTMLGNAPVYTAGDYQASFFLLPVCYLIALVVSTRFLKETYCKQQYETSTVAETSTHLSH
jgi:MFS family permease